MNPYLIEKSVTSIRVGMRVDLESCPYLKDEPSAAFEWATVNYAFRETEDCFGIGYDGIDAVGYPIDTRLIIRNGCYECGDCKKWVSYEDNLALDGTDLEHARENELCKACQVLDNAKNSKENNHEL